VEERAKDSLEQEKQYLRKINANPYFWQRCFSYWKLSGPGWIQSALTLGAGSAGSAIFAGSVFGYKLLWVQPVAYICFFILQNKKSYLGKHINKGIKGSVWNLILILAILVVAAGALVKIISLF